MNSYQKSIFVYKGKRLITLPYPSHRSTELTTKSREGGFVISVAAEGGLIYVHVQEFQNLYHSIPDNPLNPP